MLEEIWKPVDNYIGLYEISNFGKVKSLNYNGTKTVRILCPIKKRSGYLEVKLCKNGIVKQFKIHRLVAEMFILNPNKLSQVNHKDENKENNFIYNLEWCESYYNCNYGTRNDRLRKRVIQYSLQGVELARFSSIREASKITKTDDSGITKCCKGTWKTCGGYKWKYCKEEEK